MEVGGSVAVGECDVEDSEPRLDIDDALELCTGMLQRLKADQCGGGEASGGEERELASIRTDVYDGTVVRAQRNRFVFCRSRHAVSQRAAVLRFAQNSEKLLCALELSLET